MTPQQQADIFRALKDGEEAIKEQLKVPMSIQKREVLTQKLRNFIRVKVNFLREAV